MWGSVASWLEDLIAWLQTCTHRRRYFKAPRMQRPAPDAQQPWNQKRCFLRIMRFEWRLRKNVGLLLSTGSHLNNYLQWAHFENSVVAQSCPTLCDPLDCSTPGLPVHHQLPELAQTHVHQVGDAIQPPHPLSSPSPPSKTRHKHLIKIKPN